MSTTSQTAPAPTSQESTGPSPGGRVYRGRTVAELIPRIQSDLGPQAIVMRRRSGLQGGIGGFFQRPFVEIEARGGNGRVDLYDGGVEMPIQAALPTMPAPDPQTRHPLAPVPAFAPTPAAASATGLQPDTSPALPHPSGAFAEALAAAGIAITDQRGLSPAQTPPEPIAPAQQASAFETPELATSEPGLPTPAAPVTPVTPVTPAAHAAHTAHTAHTAPTLTTRTQQAVSAQLTASGIDERFAQELIEAAGAHVLSFTPRLGLRKAVQIELARRIRCAPALRSCDGTIVLVGPGGSGKTRCTASLAAIYRRASQKVSCASVLSDPKGGSLKMIMSPTITTPIDATSTRALRALSAARSEGLVLLDTPAISPAEPGAIRKLAKLLDAVCPDRVVLTLPATLGPRACSQLLDALAPLKPSALAITHADETDQLGVAVQAACASGIAPEYMLDGSRGERALSRLDPQALTERLLR